jgi:hypothetical protein
MKIKSIRSVLVGVAMIGLLITPALASAQTTSISDLQSQITALLTQLSTLRAEFNQAVASSSTMEGGMPMMMASSSMACPDISRNLSIGSQGSDVSALQTMLAQDPSVYPQGSVTGYFGPLTAAAVIRFQQKNGIASSSAGFFGPLSRNFLDNHCGMMHGMGGMPFMPWMPGASTTTGSSTPPIEGGPFLPVSSTPPMHSMPMSGSIYH